MANQPKDKPFCEVWQQEAGSPDDLEQALAVKTRCPHCSFDNECARYIGDIPNQSNSDGQQYPVFLPVTCANCGLEYQEEHCPPLVSSPFSSPWNEIV